MAISAEQKKAMTVFLEIGVPDVEIEATLTENGLHTPLARSAKSDLCTHIG